ncbi:hypothetical protein NQ315_017135 [Exocentrus adspersus]|uniref:ZSWIM1/3 RNaseH-like domain-containing protein n=1 Tax=Exocentrus adspersus TaxID=1586481 RepID=A0AAV8VC74_9CUCU|nr:hypothetical protein NQ315_017135 [Exocentrus adspersus]
MLTSWTLQIPQYQSKYNINMHIKRLHVNNYVIIRPLPMPNVGVNRIWPSLLKFTVLDLEKTPLEEISIGRDEIEKDKISKKCPLCNYRDGFKKKLLHHFLNVNDINIEIQKKEFDIISTFLAWKEETELENRSKFIKKHFVVKSQAHEITDFICHRSGYFYSEGTGKRHFNILGSKKIDGFCPANIRLIKNNDGSCKAVFLNTHVGHENDLGHLQLSCAERRMLAERIALKIPFDEILDDIRESVTEDQLKHHFSGFILLRLIKNLLIQAPSGHISGHIDLSKCFSKIETLNELYKSGYLDSIFSQIISGKLATRASRKLASVFGLPFLSLSLSALNTLLASSIRHANDAISVESWVLQMQKEGDCVLFYKAQGTVCEAHNELKKDDFVLIIMTAAQREILKKYRTDCICIDGTHGLNNYRFEMHTLLVLDNLREGFPCAFLVSNRSDKEIMKTFFNYIKTEAGVVYTKTFMSDMAEVYYNSWLEVMGESERRLYCIWHVDRAWRKNLTKISSKEP